MPLLTDSMQSVPCTICEDGGMHVPSNTGLPLKPLITLVFGGRARPVASKLGVGRPRCMPGQLIIIDIAMLLLLPAVPCTVDGKEPGTGITVGSTAIPGATLRTLEHGLAAT